MLTIPTTSLTGEGPSSGGSRHAGGPTDDDVAVVDAINSDEEIDGSEDDVDFHESEGEVVASDDGDDEIDDGDSEDEGVRPRRAVTIDVDEGGDEDVGEGDKGDDAEPSGGKYSI